MDTNFCFSIRFLDDRFHGQSDGHEMEWPPSPHRAFQALVAGAARSGGGRIDGEMRAALRWLESRAESPLIIAPAATECTGYTLSVPNNAMDIVAQAWSRGNDSNKGDANPATHRTMKTVRPILIEGGSVHYIWPIGGSPMDNAATDIRALSELAETVVAVGWGLDLAIATGKVVPDEEVERLPGERWLPGKSAGRSGLRVPVDGTLDDLVARHERFCARLTADGLVPPPPLSVYKRVEYRRATDPPAHSFSAFSLLRVDGSGFRPFDTGRRGLTVAGMVRGAVKNAAEQSGWAKEKVASFVLGHGEARGREVYASPGGRRFAYLPLPSVEYRPGRHSVLGQIRRVLLTTYSDECDGEIAWARRAIPGTQLVCEQTGEEVAMLSLIPQSDKGLRPYLQMGSAWATVTPVVLPGFDDPGHLRHRLADCVGAAEQRRLLDRLNFRIDALLRKAIVQAGFPAELAANANLDWRKTGFWSGGDAADQYGVADHLRRFSRYHVKIEWRNRNGAPVAVRGPVCIGGGRFYGAGLFASM